MNAQFEQIGDFVYARLRTRDTVYMWSVFFTLDDARKWADAHLAEAVSMQKRMEWKDSEEK